MSPPKAPRLIIFDRPPEIFATDNAGNFSFGLSSSGAHRFATASFDELRFTFSVWHPSNEKIVDLDRAYVEIRASLDPEEENHWTRLAEIEPVVPAYNAGDRFDGWIVLPVLGTDCAFDIVGRGFEPRSRIQIRASAYLVA